MLTADLAQSWLRGGRTGPRYIETDDPGYLRDAAELIRLFVEHEGKARHELDHALEEYVGLGTDYKILRGLIKLLMDASSFETASPVDPIEIRRSVFLKARPHHPLIDDENARAQIATEAALELGCAPDDLLRNLYADLPSNQRLIEFEHLDESELLDLYNLAQAQALLYRCVRMQLYVEPQGTENYRELFAAIKAYRLIHTIKGSPSKGYEVRLDGPVSMFHRSQKYGVQMAVFLPALLLCKGWSMRAEIAQKPGSSPAFFEMNSLQTRLRSHYTVSTARETSAQEKLSESWTRFESEWTLEVSSEVIDLGESAFIPDFVLTHTTNGRRFFLEILGFWTPRHMQERLKEFEHARIENFIIAASDELRGSREALTRVPPHTIIFKSKLDPIVVELALNSSISGEAENLQPEDV
jgi:predicted nuclease of restriction endonuclease-like RecB superfamily